MVDQNELLADLVEVERHIALRKADIADQEAQIAELDLDGPDRWEALDTLARLRETQEAHERRRELIIRALSTP